MRTRLAAALVAAVGLGSLSGPGPLSGLVRAAAAQEVDSVRVTLSGEARVRGELDARTSGAGTEQATLLRTRFAALAEIGERVKVYVQISDSRAFGEEASTLTDASADRLDVHQAWLAWAPTGDVEVRIGRQELAFADERLMGAVNWANVTRAFDGVRATLHRGAWSVDAFAAVLDERAALLATGLDPRANSDSTGERSLFGVWAATKHADLFALVDVNATDGPARTDIDRLTVGGRGRGALGRLGLRATAALQLGRQTPAAAPRQDISAYLLSGAAEYALPGRVAGRLGLQLDVLSGDRDPLDDSFGAFHTLYATNHAFYGFMDLFLSLPRQTGDLGLVDLIFRGSVKPGGWTLRADAHRFWLARESASGGRAIGTELDLTAARSLARSLALQAGYSVFVPSAAAEVAPVSLGEDTLHWAYLQLRAWF